MNDTVLNITGNLTADPELRFTPSGAPVVNFTVASTPRVFNKDLNAWEDGDPLYMRCSAWRKFAENIAESFVKGSRVMVEGKLKQRSYETKEGEKRTVIELDAYEVAASVRYAHVTVTKNPSSNGTNGMAHANSQAPIEVSPFDTEEADEPPF